MSCFLQSYYGNECWHLFTVNVTILICKFHSFILLESVKDSMYTIWYMIWLWKASTISRVPFHARSPLVGWEIWHYSAMPPQVPHLGNIHLDYIVYRLKVAWLMEVLTENRRCPQRTEVCGECETSVAEGECLTWFQGRRAPRRWTGRHLLLGRAFSSPWTRVPGRYANPPRALHIPSPWRHTYSWGRLCISHPTL